MEGATAHIMGEMGAVGSRHGATAHIERDGDGVVGSDHGATAHIMGEMGDGVVGSHHGATVHCHYGREEGRSGRSRHGPTAHVERDGEGVAGRAMVRPHIAIMGERGGGLV